MWGMQRAPLCQANIQRNSRETSSHLRNLCERISTDASTQPIDETKGGLSQFISTCEENNPEATMSQSVTHRAPPAVHSL